MRVLLLVKKIGMERACDEACGGSTWEGEALSNRLHGVLAGNAAPLILDDFNIAELEAIDAVDTAQRLLMDLWDNQCPFWLITNDTPARLLKCFPKLFARVVEDPRWLVLHM
jgi:hypothetical protein